ncbi:MAG: ABC transporter ATP-binding protein/permease [Lachnospiraceae bacterium]|nr:ABC transporter ATP-binding protein/permease [Lachnospiraceae bacterium]
MRDISIFTRLYKLYFSKYLRSLIFLTLLVVLFVALGSINPYLFGVLIDTMINQDFQAFHTALILYVSLNLIVSSIGIVKERITSIFSYKVSSQIKERLFKKVIYLKCVSREKYSTGELMQRIQGDSDGVVRFYIDALTNILSVIFNLAISIYFILSISPVNAVLSLLNIPLIFILNKVFKKGIARVVKAQNIHNDQRMSFLHESVENYQHVKVFCLEDEKINNHQVNILDGLDILRKNLNISNAMGIIKNFINAVINYGLFYIFAFLIHRGSLTIGQMVSYNVYVTRLYDAISKISSLNLDSISVRMSLERIEQIENELNELVSENETLDFSDMPEIKFISHLCFNKVHFAYNVTEPVLKGISLEIDKNGFYSIVGKNGSGKSTLFRLIAKFYDVENDYIYINGIDINKLSIDYIRREIIYVSKDVYIVNGSIKDNLMVSNSAATFNELEECCKKVGLYEDILSFENGFETLLGVNGNQLSSGQKQKLNFARALLKKGSIFILDEATSDLDGLAEQDFIYIIKKLSSNYIVILITHKISSVIHSDEIFVIDDGIIKESGNHHSLMHRNGLYRDMFYGIDS